MSSSAAATTSAPAPTNEVGNLIRRQRESMRMSVAHLAQSVGVSRNTITNYESGKTEPAASDLLRLSAALGCAVTDLLCGSGAPMPPRFAFRAHAPLRKDAEIAVAARKYLRAYDQIEEITNSRLQGKLRTFDGDGDGPLTDREIESAADTLRQSSGLHDTGPENIASVLEGLGVRTLFFQHPGKGLEGLSTIQGEMMLVMLRDRKRVIERTIFSAAHELGHLVALSILKMPARWPVFIPFVGALILFEKKPRNELHEAWVGLGGPIAGLLASLALHLIAVRTGSPKLLMAAAA
ncbi:MAG: helix-turn-helix domain-containing protein [Planctomycetaceae bacterium]